MSDETIWEIKPALKAFYDGVAMSLLCFVLAILLLAIARLSWIGVFLGLSLTAVGILVLGFVFLRARAYKFKLTRNSLIWEYNLFSSQRRTIPLETIINVGVSQNIAERFLKIGSIEVFTVSNSAPTVVLFGLKDAQRKAEEILSARNERINKITHA